jgi:Secretion system C-terminal sorting domain
MRKIYLLLIIFLFPILIVAEVPEFGKQQDLGKLKTKVIDEASGLVASRKYPGILWTHNDSDPEGIIYAINLKGEVVAEVKLEGIRNRDWEDIAIAPNGTSGEYDIYIGEIGDNDAKFDTIKVYKFKEPIIDNIDGYEEFTLTTNQYSTFNFEYSDGARDAESMFVDPNTKDIYVISKRESNARLYLGKYPYSNNLNKLKYLKDIKTEKLAQLAWITAADISPNGNEILMRSYISIFYYSRTNSESIESAFDGSKDKLPFGPGSEIQGEAVCWDHLGEGYYTLGESFNGADQHLYYYPRLNTSVRPGGVFSVVLKTKNNNFYLEMPKKISSKSKKIEIYNGIGKKVGQITADSLSKSEMIFDLTHLRKGLYFCRIDGKTKKILVY